MKRMVHLVACLPFWLISCEGKVTALYSNEAEQVFEIGKESELCFLNGASEVKDKDMEVQALLTDAGREIPADETRIKLVKDIEIGGEWTPIKFPVGEFDGDGHTITLDGIWVVIEKSSKGVFDVGLFEGMDDEREAVVKDLTLAGDMIIDAQKREDGYSPLAGSLTGEFKNGRVENCANKVDISSADNKGICTLRLSGLVGDLDNYGSEVEVVLHDKIINEGNLTTSPYSDAYIGGVIRRATNYGKILIKENVCVENGDDLIMQWRAGAQPDRSYIDGVVGPFRTNETDIEHLRNWGNIRLDTQNTLTAFNVGGICGGLTPHNCKRIYPLDLYNVGNAEIKHNLLAEFFTIGGVIDSFGGSPLHQVMNEGKTIVSGEGCKYISRLLGSKNLVHGSCCLHSYYVDKVGTYPVWNISYHPVTKQIPYKENHPTNQK